MQIGWRRTTATWQDCLRGNARDVARWPPFHGGVTASSGRSAWSNHVIQRHNVVNWVIEVTMQNFVTPSHSTLPNVSSQKSVQYHHSKYILYTCKGSLCTVASTPLYPINVGGFIVSLYPIWPPSHVRTMASSVRSASPTTCYSDIVS